MVSILIAAAANSLRVRNAARRLQQWWRNELWQRKEKQAAQIIERFFIYVKKEVEKEVKALKKKKKKKRRQRMIKESDEYILERAWLGVADDATASMASAVPVAVSQKTSQEYPSALRGTGKRGAYNQNDRYRARGLIQSVDEDAQSEVSGLTDMDFSVRNNNRSKLKKSQKDLNDDLSLEKAFRDSELLMAKERRGGREEHVRSLRHELVQKSRSRRDRAAGYPRRYDR